jgi:hypothetical protein
LKGWRGHINACSIRVRHAARGVKRLDSLAGYFIIGDKRVTGNCKNFVRGSWPMSYPEWLMNESECHKVKFISDGLQIQVANDTEDCRERFHRLVKRVLAEGYDVMPHKSSTDSKGRYDMAIIRIND